jgi:hypothetical protein
MLVNDRFDAWEDELRINEGGEVTPFTKTVNDEWKRESFRDQYCVW